MRALAALRVEPHVAVPYPFDELDRGVPRRVDRVVERVGLEVVPLVEAGDAVGPARSRPRPAAATDGDVDAADRLEADLVA